MALIKTRTYPDGNSGNYWIVTKYDMWGSRLYCILSLYKDSTTRHTEGSVPMDFVEFVWDDTDIPLLNPLPADMTPIHSGHDLARFQIYDKIKTTPGWTDAVDG